MVNPPTPADDAAAADTDARRPPRWRLKLAALGASIALALIAGEVVVRVFFHDEVDTAILTKKLAGIFHLDGVVEPSHDPDLLVELKRGILEDSANILVATDLRAPARISTVDPPPHAPAVRVALIGDSTSFGLGLHYDASYPAILRTMLEESCNAPVEVRNYSVPMYNSTQERIVFETQVAPWKPDLLVLHYDHNDADPPLDYAYTHLPPDFGDNVLRSALVKFALRRLRVVRNKAAFRNGNKRDTVGTHFHEGYRYAGPRYEIHLEEIRRIGEGAARLGIPAASLIYDWNLAPAGPSVDDPHFSLLHTRLLATMESAGFTVLDMYPRYQELMKTEGWDDLSDFYLAKGDRSHPNPEGHLFLARHLHAFILGDEKLGAPFRKVARPSPDAALAARIAEANLFREALLLLSHERNAEAEVLLRRAIERKPNDPGLHMCLAGALVHQRKVAPAVAELETVVRLKPDYAWAHLDLGDLYTHQKRFEEAIRHHRIVVELPANEAVRMAAVGALVRSHEAFAEQRAAEGNLDEAASLLRKAISLSALAEDDESDRRLRDKLEKLR